MTYTRHFSKTIHVPVKLEYKEFEFIYDSKGDIERDYKGDFKIKKGYIYINVDGCELKYDLPLEKRFRTFDGPFDKTGRLKEKFDVDEVVDVNICVDTDEYDKQSAITANNVILLTGSVVATESAQVESIHENAQKIAKTIVKGFFSTVKSDISTQITEQYHRVEALLVHLKTQAEELNRKQIQMEKDYHRTAARYSKIFTDLNNELENRVRQLDLPVYTLQENISFEANRMLNGDFAGMASVANRENLMLNSQIEAACQRKQTEGTIDSIHHLLISEQQNNNTLSHVMLCPDFPEGIAYLPVCFAEYEEDKGVMKRQVLMDAHTLPMQQVNEQIVNSCLVADSEYGSFGQKEREKVLPYLEKMVQNAYQNKTSEHDERVKKLTIQMFKR